MKIIKKLLITLMIMLLCACSSVKQYTAYTIYPIGYILNRIAGDRINAVSVQGNNTIVQVAQLNDNYQEILDNASVFFHIGSLEPYIDIYEDEIKQSKVNDVDLSTLNAVYEFKRYTLVYVDGKDTYIEGPFYEGDVFEEIDVDKLDLFLWLNPIGMLSMSKDVYEYLASNYVEEAAYFKDNYEKLENDLIALDAAYQSLSRKLIKENKVIKFVSMTPSFSNWQKDYGFQVYPICLSKYGALPSEEEIEIIKNRIIADDVKYIAYEPNISEDMLNLFTALESELELKRVNLSNISSLTLSQRNDNKDYMSIMYDNLSVLENMATSVIENQEIMPTEDKETGEDNETPAD